MAACRRPGRRCAPVGFRPASVAPRSARRRRCASTRFGELVGPQRHSRQVHARLGLAGLGACTAAGTRSRRRHEQATLCGRARPNRWGRRTRSTRLGVHAAAALLLVGGARARGRSRSCGNSVSSPVVAVGVRLGIVLVAATAPWCMCTWTEPAAGRSWMLGGAQFLARALQGGGVGAFAVTVTPASARITSSMLAVTSSLWCGR